MGGGDAASRDGGAGSDGAAGVDIPRCVDADLVRFIDTEYGDTSSAFRTAASAFESTR